MLQDAKKKLAQYDQAQFNLISLECMICFCQFDDEYHKPIIICTNQHNMCKLCTDKKLFKIQKKSQQQTYLCPLCNQEVILKNLRQNNLLLQVYKWISQISSRQKERILLIKSDMDDLKCQNEATKKVLQKIYEENVYLHQILNIENQQKVIQNQIKPLQKKNELKDQKDKNNLALLQMKKKLIQKYQKNLTKLKEQIEKSQKEEKQKQQFKNQVKNYIFSIDKTHDHFAKFKLSKNNTIIMQGPFYRSFFQDFNYFYNLISENQIKFTIGQLYCFQLQIVQTKKGRIFIGFGNQKISKQVNAHLKKQYFGFNIETGDFLIYGETIKSKLHGYKAQSASIYEFSLEKVKRQEEEQQANFQVYFVVSLKQESQTQKTERIKIKLIDKQEKIYPIISMQIVGDSIKIINL